MHQSQRSLSNQLSRFIVCVVLLVMTGLLLAACDAPAQVTPVPTVPLAQKLIFYDWADDLPQSIIDAFAAEYGLEVEYVVYESQEEAAQNIRNGQVYDVVVFDNSFVPMLAKEGLLAQINYSNVPNFKNISANFRDLVYDPDNIFSVPFNWGTTGLIYRRDMVAAPITRWTDLWDPRYAGKVAMWRGQEREVMGLTLKSLGYSVNTENPQELEAALARLIELKPRLLFLEDLPIQDDTSAYLLAQGEIVLAMGYAVDVLTAQAENDAVDYVLPAEGAILWGDNFVIPANSPNKHTAELFLNFLLRPEIGAKITNENLYATPNETAKPFIDPALRNNPVVFPPNEAMHNAEIILPLSQTGKKLYEETWERFIDAR